MPNPVINSIVNALDGVSAAMVITPSNDPNYVSTEILYRRISKSSELPADTAWSVSGSYAGTPGVPFNWDITLGVDNALFEVIVYDTLTADHTPPSVPLRVFCTSDAHSVQERAYNALVADCLAISVANGYTYDVADVEIVSAPGDILVDEFPAVRVIIPAEQRQENVQGLHGVMTSWLEAVVVGWVEAEEDAVLDNVLSNWQADLERAICSDRRRGGNVINTEVTRVTKWVVSDQKPIAGVAFDIRIFMRTDYGNPFQKR